MLIRKPAEFRYSEITPKADYQNRRRFLASVPAALLAGNQLFAPKRALAAKFSDLVQSPLSTRDEKPNPYKDVTTYNNFYEFGTGKEQPARLAQEFRTSPWIVSVEGDVEKPRKFSIDEILKLAPLEERIYRMRCRSEEHTSELQ